MERDDVVRRLTGAGAPFEIVEGQAGGRRHRVFRNGPASLRDLCRDTRSDRPFIAFGDERLTFDEAWRRSAAIATGLARAFGVGKGDRVAIAMRNNPEWILAFQAITSLGAVVVALNAHWTADELVFGLTDSSAKVLFADEQRAASLERALDRLGELRIVVVRGAAPAGMLAYETVFGSLQDGSLPEAAIEPDDDATILYTSGSTGRPKGVVSTHRNILTTLLSWELDSAVMAHGAPVAEGAEPPDLAALLSVPLFHVTGLHAGYLGGLRAQRRLVIMSRWNAQEAARLIETHRITHLTAPAAITGDLVAIAAAGGYNLSSLLAIGGGGAARAPTQVRELDRVFPNAAPATGW
ncbi:MAG: AMP-binding protein, partial [Phenylobacterium sp.]|nr:AMP-binding protein [Phenylobacterium sp.]